jgi:FixJ family two-component response regulator
VVAGLANKQTAAELGTSEITIGVHRGQIMRKMGGDRSLNSSAWRKNWAFRAEQDTPE